MYPIITNGRRSVMLLALMMMVGGILALSATPPTFAQDPDDSDVAPAPPSIGADIPLTYFGPAPSQVQKELIGPHQLLKAGEVDLEAGTIALPLYEGQMESGETVWYILTDTTDKGNAEALGLNWSPKLAYGAVDNGARQATLGPEATLIFEAGTVDFSPERNVTPGDAPNFFPPVAVQPGSVGDEAYSPLVVLENGGGHVYNAPMIAFDVEAEDISFCDGEPDHRLVHDKVVSICPEEATVTLSLTSGFSFARPVLYLSTDSNVDVAAAMEGATLAPGMADIIIGRDDSAFSAVERIFAFANGPTGNDNPHRQGFNSALQGEGSPLNVLGGIPTIATDYSPLWDLNLGVWTDEALEKGYDARLIEEFQILGFVELGWITGPGGEDYGSTGIIVNCPIVFRFL